MAGHRNSQVEHVEEFATELNVQENIEFPLKAQGISKQIREQRIEQMLTRVQLDEFARANPTRLSRGQQQRVVMARALVGKPAVLLKDEPLCSLDDAANWQSSNLPRNGKEVLS